MATSPSSVRSRAASQPKRLGTDVPRVWTRPLRKLTPKTSAGFECIQFAEDVLGIELLPWQKWTLIHALELLPDGTFRFRTVVLLVARQNGKSTLMQVLTLWRMYMDAAPLVIGTAQDLDTAEEQWQFVVDMAEEIPELAEEIEQVLKVNGKKQLKLSTGERYKVRAASRRAGRGLSGDLVLLDELREHQTWEAWGAVTKTTMARARGQVWAASNAGDKASVVLAFLRRLAHLALGDPDELNKSDEPSVDVDPDEDEELDGDSLGIFEYSAPPGCDKWDRDGWAQANPALGYTITEKALASAARTDPDAVFRTECLCQWVDTMTESAVPVAAWVACQDPDSRIVSGHRFALDVSPSRDWATIVVAGLTADGKPHLEVTSRAGNVDHGEGTDWVGARLAAMHARFPNAPVSIVAGGAAATLTPTLTQAGIEVAPIPASEVPAACGLFYDLATAPAPGLVHLGQTDLTIAVAKAERRFVAEKTFVWRPKVAGDDITPLYGATLALWAAHKAAEANYDVLDSFY